MRVTGAVMSAALVALVVVAGGCSSGQHRLEVPVVNAISDQGVALRDLADLDAKATVVAVVVPTGRSRIEPFVAVEGVPPTPFPIVELRVLQTIKGRIADTFELREGYTYQDARGEEVPVVSGPSQFLLYLEPYTLGDGSPWNGQWVTTAWLSGVYMDLGVDSGTFTRVDPERLVLPKELTVETARDPGSVVGERPTS